MAKSNKMGMSAGQLAKSRRARFGNNSPKVSDNMNELYDKLESGELSRKDFQQQFMEMLEQEKK